MPFLIKWLCVGSNVAEQENDSERHVPNAWESYDRNYLRPFFTQSERPVARELREDNPSAPPSDEKIPSQEQSSFYKTQEPDASSSVSSILSPHPPAPIEDDEVIEVTITPWERFKYFVHRFLPERDDESDIEEGNQQIEMAPIGGEKQDAKREEKVSPVEEKREG